MTEPIKTMPEVLAALKETAKYYTQEQSRFFNSRITGQDLNLHPQYCDGASGAYLCSAGRLREVIARIESGQAQAESEEERYKDAWERMIKAMRGMLVDQTKTRDAVGKKGYLWHGLDGTLTALEMMIEEMQEIQARIEDEK